MNASNDTLSQGELFSLASQLYVRVRRSTGRIVDAVYMVQNETYAREILQLAGRVPDVELLTLVTRYENMLNHNTAPGKAAIATPAAVELPAFDQTLPLAPAPRSLFKSAPAAKAPTPPPATVAPVKPVQVSEPAHTPEEEVAMHYIGSLR